MRCACGRYLTSQTRVVAKMYKLDGSQCLQCMSTALRVPYQDLLDRYQGYTECRECERKKRMQDRKRLLNGG